MPRLLALQLLAAFMLCAAATALNAQSRGARTTFVGQNVLFHFVEDQPLYCELVRPESHHRQMGIARMFQYALPYSGRSGQFGLSADSSVRYLLVWRDEYFSTSQYRRMATVQFHRNGALDVGRQSLQVIRADSLPPSTVTGLHAAEVEQALALARHLASRCH